MWKRITILMAVALFLSTNVEGARPPGIVRMKIAEFRPQVSVPRFWEYGLERKTPLRAEEYYIVQFEGSVREDWKHRIREYGGKFFGFIPNYCFVVRLPRDAVGKVRALPYVLWVGEFKPAYRIQPELIYEVQESERHYDRHKGRWIDLDEPGTIQLMVQTFKGEDFEALLARIKAMPGVELVKNAQSEVNTHFDHIIVRIPDRRARDIAIEIANQPEVHWVERDYIPRLFDDWSRWICQSYDTLNMKPPGEDRWFTQMVVCSVRTPIHHRGLYGAGEIIGFSDTGLDFDHSAFRDATTVTFDGTGTTFTGFTGHRKLVGYQNLAGGAGGQRDEHDHGTHVGGTIAGDSLPAGLVGGTHFSRGDGMAPLARLAKQDLSHTGGSLVGIPADLNNLFMWAYNGGARLHSNSWGAAAANNYTTRSQQADMFMWNRRNMLIFFATGNSNNTTPPDSVGAPATAKSIVSVGASEAGAGDGATYQNPGHPGRNELEDAAEFSSKGPTREDLHKPNLMAPGGWNIWSANNDSVITTNNSGLSGMGGTSMACPTAAGLTALVREYFRRGFYPTGVETPANAFIPCGALLKAMLINSTRNMTGAFTANAIGIGTAGSGSNAAPSQGQGWGRVVLGDVLFFPGDTRHLKIERDSLSVAGQTHTYTITTGPSTTEYIKIVLVWSDFWGIQTVTDPLVNDLDLRVVLPGGTFYHGSIFPYNTPRSSPNPTTTDNRNPQEVVWLDPLPNTTLTITVRATEINQGPQPYALVITGNIPGATNVPPAIASLNRLFNHEETRLRTPTLEWNVPTDPEGNLLHFRVQWDEDVNFGSPVTVESRTSTSGFSPTPPRPQGTGTCSYTVNAQAEGMLLQDTTYWWRVSAWDSTSHGSWSAPRSFTVDTTLTQSRWLITTGAQFQNCTRTNLAIQGDSLLLAFNVPVTLLSQSFEGTTFPPSGWAMFAGPDNVATNNWTRVTDISFAGAASARILHNMTQWVDRFLATPALNLTGKVNTELVFWSRVQWPAYYQHHGIWASTGGQINPALYTQVQLISPTAHNTWEKRTVSLSVHDGSPSVHFAFRYREHNGADWWIDSVVIRTFAQAISGEVVSPPIIFTDFPPNRASWDRVFWNKRLAADSIGIRVERRVGGSWVTAIPDTFIMTTASCTLDISTLGTTDTIRLVGRFFKGSASPNPILRDWSVSYTPIPTEISERDILVYSLSQNYPNPFRGGTVIHYQIASVGNVQLKVYDIAGRVVRTLLDRKVKPGRYFIRWDGKDNEGRMLASGIYFYRLSAGEFTKTRKMVLLK